MMHRGAMALVAILFAARAYSNAQPYQSILTSTGIAGGLKLDCYGVSYDGCLNIEDYGLGSQPQIKIKSDKPNIEIVSKSTDSAHGYGSCEISIAPGQSDLQFNCREIPDNTTYVNMAYFRPIDLGGGFHLRSLATEGQAIRFFSPDGHTVGLKGPSFLPASWDFTFMNTPANGGQVLGQKTSNPPRELGFTSGGSAGQFLVFTSNASLPQWSNVLPNRARLPSASLQQLLTTPPLGVGEISYCSDCSVSVVCVSTGSVAGMISDIHSRSIPCH